MAGLNRPDRWIALVHPNEDFPEGTFVCLAAPLPVTVIGGGAGGGSSSVVVSDILDGAGDSVMDPGNNAIRVAIVAGAGSGGTAMADKATFTEGVTSFTPVGGVFSDSTAPLTEDQAAAARITAWRGVHVNLRDAAGGELGTLAAPVRTDPTGATTQPVSGTVAATQGTSPWVVGDGGGSLTVDAPIAVPVPVGVTSSADVLVKPGDEANNAIRVRLVASDVPMGGGSSSGGGTSMPDKGAFVEGTSLFTPIGGFYSESAAGPITEDQAAAARITAFRAVHVNLRSDAGVELGTAGAPVRIDPTGATTQPVSGTVSATQGTSPWVVSVSGPVTVEQGTSSWIVDQVDTASLDYDTGGGTVPQTVVGIALPGSGGPVAGGTETAPVVNKHKRSDTATRTAVAGTTSPDTTILAANPSRLGAMIYNDSNQSLYLAFGAGASSSNYSLLMLKQSIEEVPFDYAGIVTGVWTGANGNARVTEFT